MAVIQYEIKDQVVDMSAVASSIEAGDLLRTMAELQKALAGVTNNNAIIATLARRIMNTGCLPTEKEIEDALGGNTKPTTNDVSQKFPLPEKNLPKCPTCGSTKLTKKGAGARMIDGWFFGRHSVEGRAQWRCENCGHLF